MAGIKFCLLLFSAAFFFFLCHSMKIDECNIPVKGRRVPRVFIRNSCSEGTLYWSYPRNSLHVTVQEEYGMFQFCIGYINDPFVKRAIVKSGGLKEKELKLPENPGKKVCFNHNGRLLIELLGPRQMKTYMAYIPYQRKKIENVNSLKVSGALLKQEDKKDLN